MVGAAPLASGGLGTGGSSRKDKNIKRFPPRWVPVPWCREPACGEQLSSSSELRGKAPAPEEKPSSKKRKEELGSGLRARWVPSAPAQEAEPRSSRWLCRRARRRGRRGTSERQQIQDRRTDGGGGVPRPSFLPLGPRSDPTLRDRRAQTPPAGVPPRGSPCPDTDNQGSSVWPHRNLFISRTDRAAAFPGPSAGV